MPFTPPPAYGPDPRIPDATERSKLEYAKSICPAAVKHKGEKLLVGCRSCPPFDASSAPDGKVEVDPDDFWPIGAVVVGSFSRAGAQQAAVVMEGCESHAFNYGGTLLVEREGTYWKPVMYASGVHPLQAKAWRRRDGLDLLVYRYVDVHQGTATDTLYSYDFMRGKDDVVQGMQVIVGLVDNAFSACWGLSPDDGVSKGEITSFTPTAAHGKRPAGLTVRVRHANTAYSAALVQRVKTACAAAKPKPDEPPTINPTQVIGPLLPHTLTFTHDGTKFVPDAGTDRTLQRTGLGSSDTSS